MFSRLRKGISTIRKALGNKWGEANLYFINKEMQKNGLRVIEATYQSLGQMSIVSFVDFGTLLGIIREKRLLDHDYDIDMGVVINDEQVIDQIRETMANIGFAHRSICQFKGKTVEDSFTYGRLRIDLSYYQVIGDDMCTYLLYKEKSTQYASGERSVVKVLVDKINHVDEIVIDGRIIPVPLNYEAILKKKYGSNWRIPDKGWVFWQSDGYEKCEQLGYKIFVEKS